MLPTTNTITTGSTTPFASPQTETIKRPNDNQDLGNRVNSVFNQQLETAPQGERGQATCTTLATKAEVLPQATIDHLCFSESPTFEFGNAYPCKFEFGGRYYLNAVACFLAQQYTDQSQVMALFTNCKTADEARALAIQKPMTKERENSWENPQAQHINKNDVMMNVLRAKFGQNLNLKKMLLATGGAYLVCQGDDPYWTDSYNGIGKNALGMCLMRLRGEYQGTSIVSPCLSYNNVILSMKEKDRNHPALELEQIPIEIIQLIAKHCLSKDGIKDFIAWGCTNKHCYISMQKLISEQITQICPGLTILDAKIQGFNIVDEPSINTPKVFQYFWKFAPHVENNEGLTLLTVPKDLTFNQQLAIAEKEGIKFAVNDLDVPIKSREVAVEDSYRIFITNAPVKGTRNESDKSQIVRLRAIGFDGLPSLDEYLLLLISTRRLSEQKISLFKGNLLGRCTYGRSSTRSGRGAYYLIVGGFSKFYLDIPELDPFGNNVGQDIGAGGQLRL